MRNIRPRPVAPKTAAPDDITESKKMSFFQIAKPRPLVSVHSANSRPMAAAVAFLDVDWVPTFRPETSMVPVAQIPHRVSKTAPFYIHWEHCWRMADAIPRLVRESRTRRIRETVTVTANPIQIPHLRQTDCTKISRTDF